MLPTRLCISVQPEINLHVELHGYGHSVLAAWFEPPFPDGFDCFLVQTHSAPPELSISDWGDDPNADWADKKSPLSSEMPGVAALKPAWPAGVERCHSDDSRLIFFYASAAWDCSDVTTQPFGAVLFFLPLCGASGAVECGC